MLIPPPTSSPAAVKLQGDFGLFYMSYAVAGYPSLTALEPPGDAEDQTAALANKARGNTSRAIISSPEESCSSLGNASLPRLLVASTEEAPPTVFDEDLLDAGLRGPIC